jgi:protein TonB
VAQASVRQLPTIGQPAAAAAAPDENQSPTDSFAIGGSTDTSPSPSDYRNTLLRHLSNYRRYPTAGLGPRLSGTAHVAFTLNRSGELLAVWIQQGSGSDVLDTEALATVRRSQPFPAPPEDMPDPLTVTLPISFVPPSD